jgi:hypothetical protein
MMANTPAIGRLSCLFAVVLAIFSENLPENEVFAAADAVVARGERPTVERVRLELDIESVACSY